MWWIAGTIVAVVVIIAILAKVFFLRKASGGTEASRESEKRYAQYWNSTTVECPFCHGTSPEPPRQRNRDAGYGHEECAFQCPRCGKIIHLRASG